MTNTPCVFSIQKSLHFSVIEIFFLLFQIAHHHHHVPVPVHLPSSYSDYPSHPYDSSGPGSYFHSRTEDPSNTTPDLASWGLGEYPSAWDDPRVTRSSNNVAAASVTEPTRLLPYGGYHHQQVCVPHSLCVGAAVVVIFFDVFFFFLDR